MSKSKSKSILPIDKPSAKQGILDLSKQLDILTENISNYFNDIHKNIDNLYLKIDTLESKLNILETNVHKNNIYYENLKSQYTENEKHRQYINDMNVTINTLMTNFNKHMINFNDYISLSIEKKNVHEQINIPCLVDDSSISKIPCQTKTSNKLIPLDETNKNEDEDEVKLDNKSIRNKNRRISIV
jgi:predicted DNA-binding protein YlxM (UPF0122 family)